MARDQLRNTAFKSRAREIPFPFQRTRTSTGPAMWISEEFPALMCGPSTVHSRSLNCGTFHFCKWVVSVLTIFCIVYQAAIVEFVPI